MRSQRDPQAFLFGQVLSDAMEDNKDRVGKDVSAKELAAQLFVDLSLVYRWRRGEALPSSEEIVTEVAHIIRASHGQEKALLQAYKDSLVLKHLLRAFGSNYSPVKEELFRKVRASEMGVHPLRLRTLEEIDRLVARAQTPRAFARLSQQAKEGMEGPDHPDWLTVLSGRVDRVEEMIERFTKSEKSDEAAEVQMNLSRFFELRAFDLGVNLAKKLLDSGELRPELRAAVRQKAAHFLCFNGQTNEALLGIDTNLAETALFLQSNPGASSVMLKRTVAEAYNCRGSCLRWKGHLREAKESYSKSFTLYDELGNITPSEHGALSNSFAVLEISMFLEEKHRDVYHLLSAKNWLDRALHYREMTGQAMLLSVVWNNRGHVDLMMGQYKEAKKDYLKALELKQPSGDYDGLMEAFAGLSAALSLEGRGSDAIIFAQVADDIRVKFNYAQAPEANLAYDQVEILLKAWADRRTCRLSIPEAIKRALKLVS